MKKKYFGRQKCICCPAMLSNNARGRASHMRAHVRDGEAVQTATWPTMRWRSMPKPDCVLTEPTYDN